MIRRKNHGRVAQSYMRVDEIQQRRNLPMNLQGHVHLFLAVWAKPMAHIIVRRKTDAQEIGIVVSAQLLVGNRFFSEGHQEIVRERSVVKSFVKRTTRRFG